MFVRARSSLSLAGPLWSNDQPLVVRYQGQLYFPLVQDVCRRRPSAAISRRPPIISIRISSDRFSAPPAISRCIRRTTTTTTR